jgi:hypothetical protein
MARFDGKRIGKLKVPTWNVRGIEEKKIILPRKSILVTGDLINRTLARKENV